MSDTEVRANSTPWDLGAHWRRVVAIGDVHADLDATLRILLGMKIIDEDGCWMGSDTLLILVGDIVDRGPDGVDLISYLMDLQRESDRAGGQLECLIGNHEIAVVDGNFSSISDNEADLVADFVCGDLQGLHAFYRGRSPAAMWLRSRPTVVKSGSSIFVHGGIDTWAQNRHPEWINKHVSRWVAYLQGEDDEPDFDTQFLVEEQGIGPTWSRRFRYPAEYLPKSARIDDLIARILMNWGGSRFVVGHCPTIHNDWRIALEHPFYGSRIVNIDTGICRYYAGTLSALQIDGDEPSAFHFDRGESDLQLTGCLRERYAGIRAVL